MTQRVLGRAIAVECNRYLYTNDLNVADYRERARVLGQKQDQDSCPQQAFGDTR